MADETAGKQPSNRRVTSSGKHPFPGLPLPERLRKKQDRAQSSASSTLDRDQWSAEVRQVDFSAQPSYDYISGQGLETCFKEGGKEKCLFECNSPPNSLEMNIRVCKGDESEVIKTFRIPEQRLMIRIFYSDDSIEVGDKKIVWIIKLKSDMKPDNILVASKAMLRRLESVMSRMPAEWFHCRNFAAPHQPQEGLPYLRDGVLYQPLGGGITWRFTGALTSPEFLRGMNLRDDPETSHSTPVSQSQGSVPKTAGGKKAERLAPKKQRRSKRVEERFGSAVADHVTPSAPVAPAASVAPEATAAPAAPAPLVEWEIDGLLESRLKNGAMQYLVKWSGNWQPSWEPEENCSAESIRLFEMNGPHQSSSSSPPENSSPPETSGENSPYEPTAPKGRGTSTATRAHKSRGARRGRGRGGKSRQDTF